MHTTNTRAHAPVTTKCIVDELESLGEELRGAKLLARRMEFRKCAHRETFSACECLKMIIGA